MANEREPSSSAQKPSLLRGLLGILASVFAAWSLSKLCTPFEKSSGAAHDQDSTESTQSNATIRASPTRVVVESLPSPTESEKTANQKKEGRARLNLGAQIVTAGLVFVYATVAIFQWCEMRKTTSDNREVQAAKLTIEILPEDIHIIPGKSFHGNVKFVVRNGGHTVATGVFIEEESGGCNLLASACEMGDIKYLPNPRLNSGESLAPGIPHTYLFSFGSGPAEEIIKRPATAIFRFRIQVSYWDIFGRPQIVTTCQQYDAEEANFFPCIPGAKFKAGQK